MKFLLKKKLNKTINQINSYKNSPAPASLFAKLSKFSNKLPVETCFKILNNNYLFDVDYSNYASYILSLISPKISNDCQRIIFQDYILGKPFDILCYPSYDPGYICLSISKLRDSKEIPRMLIEKLDLIDWNQYETFHQSYSTNSDNRYQLIKDFSDLVDSMLPEINESDKHKFICDEYAQLSHSEITLLAFIVVLFKYVYRLIKYENDEAIKIKFYNIFKKAWYLNASPKIKSISAEMIGMVGNNIGKNVVFDLLSGLECKNVNVIFSICKSISKIGLPYSKQAVPKLTRFLEQNFIDTSYFDGIQTATEPFFIKKMLFPSIAWCLSEMRPDSDETVIPLLFKLVKENSDNVLGYQLAVCLIAFDLPYSTKLIPILENAVDNPFIFDELIYALAEFKPPYIGDLYDKLESPKLREMLKSKPELREAYQIVINQYKYQP